MECDVNTTAGRTEHHSAFRLVYKALSLSLSPSLSLFLGVTAIPVEVATCNHEAAVRSWQYRRLQPFEYPKHNSAKLKHLKRHVWFVLHPSKPSNTLCLGCKMPFQIPVRVVIHPAKSSSRPCLDCNTSIQTLK
jgi:hypothetical protein